MCPLQPLVGLNPPSLFFPALSWNNHIPTWPLPTIDLSHHKHLAQAWTYQRFFSYDFELGTTEQSLPADRSFKVYNSGASLRKYRAGTQRETESQWFWPGIIESLYPIISELLMKSLNFSSCFSTFSWNPSMNWFPFIALRQEPSKLQY